MSVNKWWQWIHISENTTRVRIIEYAKCGLGCCLFMCEMWCFYSHWIWCYENLYITPWVLMATKISILTPFQLDVSHFWFLFDKGYRMFVWIATSVATYVLWIHQGFIKATTPLTLTWFFWACTVARQQHKMHNSLTLSLKFYFEKKNEFIYAI